VQAEPLVVRTETGDAGLDSFDAAMKLACDRAIAAAKSPRKVAVAHCFAAGGDTSDSERPLSVGGSDQVSPSNFAAFNYVALGHLHRPQKVGSNGAYSGSLLKYSFSEAAHNKSVSVVEIDASGEFTRREEALSIRRDVRIIEAKFDELLNTDSEPASEDYVLARLTDHGALRDPLARLRERFPNILAIERPTLYAAGVESTNQTIETLKRTDDELFASFFKDVTGNPLNDAEQKAMSEAFAALSAQSDESDSA